MAGIGWKLERMLDKGTLSSTLQAYLTGVAVTSAPWLLTTAVLVTLRVLARGQVSVELANVELLITIAYAVTLVLSAPIHVVVSRYAADRLYARQLELVGAPLRRALMFTVLGFLAVGAIAMAIAQPPLALAMPAAVLTAIVAGQWLLLGVGGGMSAPAGVLRAFAIGAIASVLAAIALDRGFGLGARGYLCGFTLGQGFALILMLVRILKDLPAHEAPVPAGALRGAFHEYKLLALSALAVHAAVWIDKLCTWAFYGAAEARTLSTASALSWFAVIPAFAWIYVQVETAFYRVFRGYFGGIESGASLDQLEESAGSIRTEAGRLVRGAIIIQFAVLSFAELGAPYLIEALSLPVSATLSVQLGLVAASLQVLTLLGMLLLYYLDLRREACIVAVCELLSIAGCTSLAGLIGAPAAAGAAVGALLPAVVALLTIRRVVSSLVPDTFQSQPYGELV